MTTPAEPTPRHDLSAAMKRALVLIAQDPDDVRASNRSSTDGDTVRIHMRTAQALRSRGLVTLELRGDGDAAFYDIGLTEAGRRFVGR